MTTCRGVGSLNLFYLSYDYGIPRSEPRDCITLRGDKARWRARNFTVLLLDDYFELEVNWRSGVWSDGAFSVGVSPWCGTPDSLASIAETVCPTQFLFLWSTQRIHISCDCFFGQLHVNGMEFIPKKKNVKMVLPWPIIIYHINTSQGKKTSDPFERSPSAFGYPLSPGSWPCYLHQFWSVEFPKVQVPKVKKIGNGFHSIELLSPLGGTLILK